MSVSISELSPEDIVKHLKRLAEILHANVLEGASVGYVLPFSHSEAEEFWQDIIPSLSADRRRVLVASEAGLLIGTVSLVQETRPNGLHRAEISKLLVHPMAQKRGIGRALMGAVETLARQRLRTLLVLDTAGDVARSLYLSLGYQVAGEVPGYAMAPDRARIEPTTFMFKKID